MLPEAPGSRNLLDARCQGYDCLLTLRGMDPVGVLTLADQLMAMIGTGMAEAGDLVWATKQHLPRMVVPRAVSGLGDPHHQRLLDLPATFLLGQQEEPACPA